MSDGALTPLVDAMRESWASTLDLVRSLEEDDWSRPTRCPGWTVHDQVAHIVALEQLLAGGELPPEAPPAAHVRNEFGAHMERGVHALRWTSDAELTALLEQAIETRTVALQHDPPTVGSTVLGVMGNQVPAEATLPVRAFDLWAHEQDIRAAVGRRGLGSPLAAALSRDIIASMLPKHWVKEAGATSGQALVVHVTGDLPFDRTVVVGLDGRAAYAEGWAGAATTTLTLDWYDLAARACGRAGATETAVRIDGDEAMGRAVVDALPMSP